ncbi:sucrase ferredoxin [Microbacterium sp. zg.B48]|uniref:sucrase ferredoxin n=1 Tax=unclassified Microbacterium TaxID=2609290 RepID=UPI00214CB39F|nr:MULTISPECIES: sucrase ferredoxin [unclassified Microbacterium]MCR2765029.1 sucrase ferredoxin [Microbacterium sp. zg.B48]MCR2811207.1 sucrase ferredoxin [Microbacterium sp. zg.B185]WIM19806.1 sucrase ferredoxin [Microbacterium sp. zg-B185]
MSATALPSGFEPVEPWEPCSDRSLERGDPLAGTGGFGARWLLIEIDGAWGAHAFFQSRIDPALGRTLVRRAEAAGIRPVAIRRYGRRADERRGQKSWRWALADARPGLETVRWGVVDDPAALADVPLDGTAGTASDRPVLLVCTHARHDQCCAVRGRPVARALAEAFPDETWESSHLGGDRFAATMLLLPHGLYYGRVATSDAASIVERYLRGEVVEEHFRGRSSLSNVAQAAQSFARASSGDDRIDSFAPLREERTVDGWRVDLAQDGGIVTVLLRETMSAPLLSTCSATRPAPVRQFALESISPPH